MTPNCQSTEAGPVAGFYTIVLPPSEHFLLWLSVRLPPPRVALGLVSPPVLHSRRSHGLRCLSLCLPAVSSPPSLSWPRWPCRHAAPRPTELGAGTGPYCFATAHKAAPPACPLLPQSLPCGATVPPRSRAPSSFSIVPHERVWSGLGGVSFPGAGPSCSRLHCAFSTAPGLSVVPSSEEGNVGLASFQSQRRFPGS